MMVMVMVVMVMVVVVMVMVVAFFAMFSQIGAMVLLISPDQIKLESCASAQIYARGEGNG